jgi:thiol:disulfide interchange protein
MMRPILFMLLALIWAAPAAGQSVVRTPHTTVELLAETAAPAPGAKTTLAIRMTPSPGWHTYWKNPGGAGLETRADWTLPAGVSAGPLRYPVPSRFLVSGIMNYVYKGPSALLADLNVGSGLAAGTSLPVRLKSAVALNIAGLFEIPALRIGGEERAARPGSSGAFWTGVLAAVVATPCTGPFMGVALGAAILMPPLTGLIVFGGLGLGLALPFLALAFIPPLRRRLPRPGPWLITFRRILAVPMFAAAFALAWVLGRQTGTGGLILGLGGVLLLGLALWWLGLRQQRGARAAAPLAIAAAAAVAVIAMPPAEPSAASVNVAALPGSVSFSGARLAALRSERRPGFLYFTADWCITCKVNENGALASARVRDTFDRAGVVTMVGDWTNADAEITRFLESRGRAGVPLYLFYDANGGETVLPQILDEERLLALVAPRA